MATAKKTPARKAPAKRGPVKRKPAKKAPAKHKATASVMPVDGYLGKAIKFISGKDAHSQTPAEIATFAANWKECRCEEMPRIMALAALYSAAIHGPNIAIRLLRKATGQPIDGAMDDELLEAVNSASDQQKLLCVYSAWVMRRAAFAPKAHSEMYGWANIILKIVMADGIAAGAGLVEIERDQKPSEMAAGVLHEPGTDGAVETATDAAESTNYGAQADVSEPRETSMGGQSAG